MEHDRQHLRQTRLGGGLVHLGRGAEVRVDARADDAQERSRAHAERPRGHRGEQALEHLQLHGLVGHVRGGADQLHELGGVRVGETRVPCIVVHRRNASDVVHPRRLGRLLSLRVYRGLRLGLRRVFVRLRLRNRGRRSPRRRRQIRVAAHEPVRDELLNARQRRVDDLRRPARQGEPYRHQEFRHPVVGEAAAAGGSLVWLFFVEI